MTIVICIKTDVLCQGPFQHIRIPNLGLKSIHLERAVQHHRQIMPSNIKVIHNPVGSDLMLNSAFDRKKTSD